VESYQKTLTCIKTSKKSHTKAEQSKRWYCIDIQNCLVGAEERGEKGKKKKRTKGHPCIYLQNSSRGKEKPINWIKKKKKKSPFTIKYVCTPS
jgi:hypothetical protein